MRAFFDTNIVIYAQQTGEKAERARALLADGGVLSVQVLNEFVAVARRKQNKAWGEIADAIADTLALVEPPLVLSLELHIAARALAELNRLSFYDALIVASAIEAGCDCPLQRGHAARRRHRQIDIRNPFGDGLR